MNTPSTPRPTRGKTVLLLVAVGSVVAIVHCAAAVRRDGAPTEAAVSTTGRRVVRAPDFPADLPWLNTARPISLAELRGKVVLIDFWTYCCINCMHIIPELEKLEEKWANELVVIGVHSAKFTGEGDTENIREAILRYQINHPVINDAGFKVWQAYGVRAWPTLALVDPEGYVVGVQSGEITFDQMDPVIRRLVDEAKQKGTLKPGPFEHVRERDKVPMTVLSFPGKLLADAAGGRLFIADSTHHRYVIASLDGEIKDVIGRGEPGFEDGSFERASFRKPQGMALVGDRLYLCDTENHALRVADLTARTVATLAGNGRKPTGYNRPGAGREVSLHSPWDVVALGDKLYVCNAGSHQLWVVDAKTGRAEPFAGSGREDIHDGPRFASAAGQFSPDPGVSAALAQPSGITTDGLRLFWVDSETSSVRGLTLGRDAEVSTLVGRGLFEFGDQDGVGGAARLQHPLGIALAGDLLYVADTYNNKIKRLDPATNRLETFAGTGRQGAADGLPATFDEPGGLSYAGGKLYVADTNNSTIRVIDLATKQTTTLALRNVDMAEPPGGGLEPAAVQVAAMTVAPGDGSLKIDLVLPAGYKLNPLAPFTVSVKSDPAGLASVGESGRVRLQGQHLPVSVPVKLAEGTGTVTVEVDVYACTEDGTGACTFQTLRFEVPLTVKAGATGGEIALTGP